MTQPRMPGLRPRPTGNIFQLLDLINTLEEQRQRADNERRLKELERQKMLGLGIGSLADAPTPQVPSPIPTPTPGLVPAPDVSITPEQAEQRASQEEEGRRRRDAFLASAGFGGSEEEGDLPLPPFMPDVTPKPEPEHKLPQNFEILKALGAVDAVGGETVAELFAQLPKVLTGQFGDIEPPTLITQGPGAALESFSSRTGSFDIPGTNVTIPIEQIGVGVLSPSNLLLPDFGVIPGPAAVRAITRGGRRTPPIPEVVPTPQRATPALGPGIGRTVTGAIPQPGTVVPPIRPRPPVVQNSIVIVTPRNLAGERLFFSSGRQLRRAVEELGQRSDIQVLPGTATASEVEQAALRVAREFPSGTQTTIPVERVSQSGGQVAPRSQQRQFQAALDPERLDDMRSSLRQIEARIRKIPPGKRPNSPNNMRIRALTEQADNLRQAIRETQGPRVDAPELDIPGVVRRTPITRVTPSTQKALTEGIVRPTTPVRPRESAVGVPRRGVPFEASTPEEAAEFRSTIRRSLLSQDKDNQILEANVARERTANLSSPEVEPTRTPGTAIGSDMGTPPPNRPEVALGDILDIPTHESPSIAAMRRLEGARNAAANDLKIWQQEGMKLRRELGITDRSFTREGMQQTFQALHGEFDAGLLPQANQRYMEVARQLMKEETEDSMEFFARAADTENKILMSFDAQHMAERFMAHPDYFPRNWKTPARDIRGPGGRIISRPGFTKPRLESSFTELLEYGLEPQSWDPHRMAMIRRINGIEFRETVILMNRLKKLGKILPKDEAPETWRVPRDIPLFEGRPIPGQTHPDGAQVFTPPMAVPGPEAGFIEQIYGARAKMFVGNRDIARDIDTWSSRFKLLKLPLTFFQHIDIGARATFSTFSLTGISRGAPIQYPALLARLMKSTWWPGARRDLDRLMASRKPMYKDFDISPRMLVEEGLTSTDLSIISRDMTDAVNREIIATNPVGTALASAKKLQDFFTEGLFDGVYRVSQMHMAQTFVIPSIRRAHPNWTPRQVAAETAYRVNLMTSTQPRWQQVIKSPDFRRILQWGIFSLNEQTGLLGQALGTVVGPRKAFWLEWWGGVYASLALFGNLINIAATGKLMGPEAYSPIDINDPYGPFKFSYNRGFMSPQLPFLEGRNGTPVHLDIVGQMDTVFTWMADPMQALAARANVVPRTLADQIKGETFFGNPLNSAQKRAVQFLIDIGAPIGATQALGAVKSKIPGLDSLVQDGEDRLGTAGQLVQSTGLNLRGQNTADLLDSNAQEKFGVVYRDLEPYQRDIVTESPTTAAELGLRRETAMERGAESSTFFAELDRIDEERITSLDALVASLKDRTYTDSQGVEKYFEIEQIARVKKEEAATAMGQEYTEREAANENQKALEQYYSLPEIATDNGIFNSALYSRLRDMLESSWTPLQREYVQRNTNRRPVPRELLSILPIGTTQRFLDSIEARQRDYQRSVR